MSRKMCKGIAVSLFMAGIFVLGGMFGQGGQGRAGKPGIREIALRILADYSR